nr:MAG TPA_asm: Repressor protein CI [Caudoviricetes sp.]
MSDLGNKEIMAENIQYYMDLNNKSRRDVCNDLGLVYSTFSDWVNGNKYPRIDKIELMANYFGISKAELVERRDRSDQLSKKNERDIQKRLQSILDDINEDGMAMFNGDSEMDEETKALLRASIETSVRLAKIRAKEKFTPKKHK